MARSARASIKKINNRRLKKTVFGPAEDARTKRLSEKLLSLASQPKPERIEKDSSKAVLNDDNEESDEQATMDVDDGIIDDETMEDAGKLSRKQEKRNKINKIARIDKKKRSKKINQAVFKTKRRPIGTR